MTSFWQKVRRFFRNTDELDQADEERTSEERAEYVERLSHDPFRFPDQEAYERFRRRHGFRRPGR